MKKNETFKWALFVLLMIWGFVSFLLLAGDADPVHRVDLFTWAAMKLAAAVSLIACYRTVRGCYRRRLLPDIVYTVEE